MSKVSDPYERQHIANLAKYGKLIDEIFKTATQEAAQIGALVGASGFDASRVFSFSDYPLTQKRIKSLLARLANNVEVAIVNGIETEWTLANNKNSALSRRVFGDNVGRLTQAQYRRYFSTNDDARQAFLQRKEQGLNLSERVWRYAQGFKNDIELGLDVGIRNGLDADAMSRELRQYLKYPDKLFRRVRDEHGNLVLSKRAADFHPGQGVYRSSYKNARRLAATEINMAYRTADYERMQQLDFVVGIEVCLSNNHPIHDICDDLCGRYPKAFKFTGWHPHCRCYVVSILKTEAELMAENRAILAGEEPSDDSVNRVDDVPRGFKEWVKQNSERVKYAQSLPYFIRDNGQYFPQEFLDGIGMYTLRKSPSVMGDVIENLHKLIDPAYIKDSEVKEMIMDFANKNPQLFIHGLEKVTITRAESEGSFMTHLHHVYTDNGLDAHKPCIIRITDKEFILQDGRRFSPLQDLKGAMRGIVEGRKLAFREEYAIESLWHEIRHAGAVGWYSTKNKNFQLEATMEMINQFCARRSYGELVKALGGKIYNQTEIIANGFGYCNQVKNLNSILEYYGIKPQSLYRHFKDRIQTSAYENIYEDLAQFLARSIGLNVYTVKKQLIDIALAMPPDDFRKHLGF